MDTNNSTIDTRGDSVIVTTGELVTVFRKGDDIAAANQIASLHTQIERLKQWAADCQSGMYVNCVYCGHRYGPREDTPVAMADVLREHIEQCPEHPLSAARSELTDVRAQLADAREVVGWAQAVLTALACADVASGSPLHKKLRDVLIAYRAKEVQIDHVYEPFTTRDGSQACRHCDGIPSMHEATVETGWLIEARTQAGPVWLVSQCVNGWSWTAESHKAIRFSRRSDAEQAVAMLGATDVIITEHQWG